MQADGLAVGTLQVTAGEGDRIVEALAALGGLDQQALHAQLAAAIDVIIHMARTPAGRVIHQIGVLVATPGKPLSTRVLWENGTPLDGWEELTCSL